MGKFYIGATIFALVSIFSCATSAEPTQGLSAALEYTHSDIKFDNNLKLKFDGGAVGFSSDPQQKYGLWGKLEFSQNSKSDSEYYEGTLGMHYNLYSRGAFYLNGLAGIGYSRLDSGITNSNMNFISLPIGVEAGYGVFKNLDLFASVGYKWMFDVTGNKGYFGNGATSLGSSSKKNDDKTLCGDGSWFDGKDSTQCSSRGGLISNPENKTLCKNGTWSDSSGSGTCSWNDGIYEEEKSGSLLGFQEKYGNSVSFGDAETPMYKIGFRFRF
ncbi:hypothetical protein [Acinetobacter sp. Ac_5812]|uniref:hypothetical protein n=1 Tax=Acinetobacter sp. Ac_5812 TaxID=1848937 RepID=UPI00148F6170|nr:hypothetical protein [Acinetobacter sp. Ac_5812]